MKGDSLKKEKDAVILKVKNIPQSHWPLARVTEIYIGFDSVVCIVKLRTPTNEFVIPANKLTWWWGSGWWIECYPLTGLEVC